ncbi:hypothetical protein H4R20_003930 [Coemansia guatemalensis]|uniref:Nucleoporin Nup54 alpha-helical domain-containing protein n=1 Tax=Coemansia guatemalensis TaxID=2761395 RepID=A0A9W8HZK5_9FUNG|nr:hypothetical protein H4R20_003930 [Coemansia guatemalensis]
MFNFNTGAAGNTGGNLFGAQTPSTGAPTTSLFGSTSAAPSGGSIFGGGANASAAPGGGSMFGGGANASAAPSSGSMFGSTANTSAAPSGGSFFGNTANTSAAPGGGSLFGGATSTSTAANTGGIFGSTANTTAAPASGSMFGTATSTSAAPSTGGVFGSTTNTSAAPASGSMFGTAASTSTAAPANTSTAAAAITRKTRFVDLPASVQQQLAAVEKQKQVQMQIGSSIMADDTEREVEEVGRAVQRLAQDLQVAKMTLAADRERVEDAKRHVTFAIKHAEKGASLIAHATDDGSWAQSGLTPLQVANRQKALQSRLAEPSSSAPLLFQSADRDTSEGPSPVDPYEAVRRIQVASIHYDVASDYYWAWMARVEASAKLLAERLDQLERHVSGAIAQQQSANTDAEQSLHAGSRLSPKAVSDIIQYQNDSFLAIAGKVAALDEDVRKLCRRLALKESSALRGSAVTLAV